MPQILIVECDTPKLVKKFTALGKHTSAGCFERAFVLISNHISVEVINPYADRFSLVSIDFQRFDGVVFTGANVPWCVDAPEALPLRQTIERAFMAEKPVFGSCNGLQLAALALGGENKAAADGMEIGLAQNIMLSDTGKLHPMHYGRTQSYAALCIHRDHILTLPEGADVTAGNVHSQVQAMIYEQGNIRFWGTQYHPEYTLNDIIESVTDVEGLFYSAPAKVADLQEAMQYPTGRNARRLGAYGNDLQPQVLRTELANWVRSLD
jgi:GMP synthase (glutamine-hydrolysing)